MANNQDFVLEERDATSIARSKNKKKARRKRPLKNEKKKYSSKTNIRIDSDHVHINKQDDDLDSMETDGNKMSTILNTRTVTEQQNGQKQVGKPS